VQSCIFRLGVCHRVDILSGTAEQRLEEHRIYASKHYLYSSPGNDKRAIVVPHPVQYKWGFPDSGDPLRMTATFRLICRAGGEQNRNVY